MLAQRFQATPQLGESGLIAPSKCHFPQHKGQGNQLVLRVQMQIGFWYGQGGGRFYDSFFTGFQNPTTAEGLRRQAILDISQV